MPPHIAQYISLDGADLDENAAKLREVRERQARLDAMSRNFYGLLQEAPACSGPVADSASDLFPDDQEEATSTEKSGLLLSLEKAMGDAKSLQRPSISWGAVQLSCKNVPSAPEPLMPPPSGLRHRMIEEERKLATDAKAAMSRQTVYIRSKAKPPSRGAATPPPPQVKIDALVFDSHFECGNLQQAWRVGPHEYDLSLCKDYNTNGHTQWFYFSMANMEPGRTYTFHIVNLEKPASLFNAGMQPVLYSARRAKESAIGWHRTGQNIAYYPSSIARRNNGLPYYRLTFSLVFPHGGGDGDVCFLASSVPYSLLDLRSDLLMLAADPTRSKYVRREILNKTLGGIGVDVVTVMEDDPARPFPESSRQVIALSARVHPGETQSSWMMRGALWWLTGESEEARNIRRHYLIKLVPMLNPDGVVLGNYRCSMAGLDLNRQWHKPSRRLTPTIYAWKKLLKDLGERLVFFCDCHGHSRKMNAFMYGCHHPHHEERAVPFLMNSLSDKFSYGSCSFKVTMMIDYHIWA